MVEPAIPIPHLMRPSGEAAERYDWVASAPAKLNLFLHITGQRSDGYHELQTVFQFLNLTDQLAFRVTEDPQLLLSSNFNDVVPADNLVSRAAEALRQASGFSGGCQIHLHKRIPSGAGLGGGSSDAATTLVVLNHLWRTGLSAEALQQIGQGLGADVPVFVAGSSCWAEGIGERMQYFEPGQQWHLLVYPGVKVETPVVFKASELTRNCSPITIRDFVAGAGENVCQPVVLKRYPAVRQVYQEMRQMLPELEGELRVRMTGTGSCLFIGCERLDQASNLYESFASKFDLINLPGASLAADVRSAKGAEGLRAYLVRGMNRSALFGD